VFVNFNARERFELFSMVIQYDHVGEITTDRSILDTAVT